jgi:integrase
VVKANGIRHFDRDGAALGKIAAPLSSKIRSTVTESERKRLRGVVFEVATKVEAARMFAELHRLAWEAAGDARAAEFLDALDKRANTGYDPGPRFKDFANRWYETSVVGGGLRESQRESDRSILDLHILPAFGHKFVKDITARDLDAFKAAKLKTKHQFGEGYAPKTINNQIAVLHRIFEKAIEYNIIEKNPVTKRSWFRRDRTAEDSREWWTPDEEEKAMRLLLGPWRERDLQAAVTLTTQILLGLRFSEVRALEKRDLDLQVEGPRSQLGQCAGGVDWQARKIVSTPKNKRARFHVIPRALAEELQNFMLRTESQLLFPDPRGGVLANKVLNRWYRDLATEAGVRHITSHGARHTAGSSYAVMGAGQKVIGALLGHSDSASTERYTHVAPSATAALVQARWLRLGGGEGGR